MKDGRGNALPAETMRVYCVAAECEKDGEYAVSVDGTLFRYCKTHHDLIIAASRTNS